MGLFELVLRAGPWLPAVVFWVVLLVPLALTLASDRARARRLFASIRALRGDPRRTSPTSEMPSALLEGRLECDDVVPSLVDGRPCVLTNASARTTADLLIARATARGLRLRLDDGTVLPLVGEAEVVWSAAERVQPKRLTRQARERVDAALVPNAVSFDDMRVAVRSVRRGERVRVHARVRPIEAGATYRGSAPWALEACAGERAISVAPSRLRSARVHWTAILAPTLAIAIVSQATFSAFAYGVSRAEPSWEEQAEPAYLPGTFEAIGLVSLTRRITLSRIQEHLDASILDDDVVAMGLRLAEHQGCIQAVLYAAAHSLDDEVLRRAPTCEFPEARVIELRALRRLGRIDDAAALARAQPDRIPTAEAARALVEAGDLEGARVVAHSDPRLYCLDAALSHAPARHCHVLGPEPTLRAALDQGELLDLAADLRGVVDVLLGHPPACDALCRAALGSDEASAPIRSATERPYAYAPRAVLAALRIRDLVMLGDRDAALALAAREGLGAEARLSIEAFLGDPTSVAAALEAAHLDERTTARIAGVALARMDGRLAPLSRALADYPSWGGAFCVIGWSGMVGRADSRVEVLEVGDDRSGRELAHAMEGDGATTELWLAAQHVRRSPAELAHQLAYFAADVPWDQSLARLYARAILLRTIARTLHDDALATSLDARIAAWDALLDRADLARPLRALDDALRWDPPAAIVW